MSYMKEHLLDLEERNANEALYGLKPVIQLQHGRSYAEEANTYPGGQYFYDLAELKTALINGFNPGTVLAMLESYDNWYGSKVAPAYYDEFVRQIKELRQMAQADYEELVENNSELPLD